MDYPLRPIELPSSPVELASVKIMNSTPGIGGPRPVKGPGEVSIAALAKRVALDQLFMFVTLSPSSQGLTSDTGHPSRCSSFSRRWDSSKGST